MQISADERVKRWILGEFREAFADAWRVRESLRHLAACDGAEAADVTGGDGSYGCETGCEYVRLEAVITCPHGRREEWTWGEFGELADILEGLEEI